MAKMFISYRRDESKGYVGRLYDSFLSYFDKNQILVDIYTIESGEDFVTAIERAVSSCDTLIAIIGPKWLEIRDKKGIQRIKKSSDYVRLEIAAALKHKLQIIPVLVEHATMPGERDLPGDLADLSRCNALELRHEQFAYDVDRLVQTIGGAYGKVGIHLGLSYQSLVKTRMIDHHILFEVHIDGDKVGEIQGPNHNMERREISGESWKSLMLRVGAGYHHLIVIYRRSKIDKGISSNEVVFRLKGGQLIQFMVERESSSLGYGKIIVEPYKPIFRR
jgi:hypothetical protein